MFVQESVNLFCEIVIRIYYLFETQNSKQFVEHCKRLSNTQLNVAAENLCNCLLLEQLKEFYDMFMDELCFNPTDIFVADTVACFNKVRCKVKTYKYCGSMVSAEPCYKVDLYDAAITEDKTWGAVYNIIDSWQQAISTDERKLLFLKICFAVYLLDLKKQELLDILKKILSCTLKDSEVALFKDVCVDSFAGTVFINVADSVKLIKNEVLQNVTDDAEKNYVKNIVDFVQEFCNMLTLLEENNLYWCCNKRKYLKLLLADIL